MKNNFGIEIKLNETGKLKFSNNILNRMGVGNSIEVSIGKIVNSLGEEKDINTVVLKDSDNKVKDILLNLFVYELGISYKDFEEIWLNLVDNDLECKINNNLFGLANNEYFNLYLDTIKKLILKIETEEKVDIKRIEFKSSSIVLIPENEDCAKYIYRYPDTYYSKEDLEKNTNKNINFESALNVSYTDLDDIIKKFNSLFEGDSKWNVTVDETYEILNRESFELVISRNDIKDAFENFVMYPHTTVQTKINKHIPKFIVPNVKVMRKRVDENGNVKKSTTPIELASMWFKNLSKKEMRNLLGDFNIYPIDFLVLDDIKHDTMDLCGLLNALESYVKGDIISLCFGIGEDEFNPTFDIYVDIMEEGNITNKKISLHEYIRSSSINYVTINDTLSLVSNHIFLKEKVDSITKNILSHSIGNKTIRELILS